MMTKCQNATYYEVVNITIALEEKNRKHKEAKKKATSSSFSGHGQKRQRIIYHPQSHERFPVQPPFRGSFPPLQYRPGQQVYRRPTTVAAAPRQPNALGVHPTAPLNHNYCCYNCGKPGHFSKECPYSRQNNPTFQRPPTGQPQPSQFKNVAQKGQNAQMGKPAKVGQVFHTEVETIPEGEPVMMGTFPVAGLNHPALMVFYFGASHTFINRTFVIKYVIPIGETKHHFYMQSPGRRLSSKEMVYLMPIEFGGHSFPTSMIVLKDQDIDVILGMNWMAQRGVVLDILHRTIKMPFPNGNSYLFIQLATPKWAIEQVHATTVKEVENIPVVHEFPDVFPVDLPGVPPDRDVEFSIELKPGTTPISRRAYRMAPKELVELKTQLQELLEKGFIQPSSSPWCCLALFVKKKD